MIVETGYSYKWEVPGSDHDMTGTWPYTEEGQAKFMDDLVAECERYENVTGLFWWWLEYNAYGTTLEGWYNAPLFDSTTGRATLALKELAKFATPLSGIEAIEPDGAFNEDSESVGSWYDLTGRAFNQKPTAPGIYIHNNRKILIK